MKRSKRYSQALELKETQKAYELNEAIELLKKMPSAGFDETIEFCCQLGVNPRQSDQMVRGSVVLPEGTGKEIRVLVFCEPEKEEAAKKAGADYLGSQEVVEKIQKENWLEFDQCISTPGMMKLVGRLGKLLGPRGLMPSPKTGTVTENIEHAISQAKRGKIDFRMDKMGCVHTGLGKLSFSEEALMKNVAAFVNALRGARPSSVKGEFLKSCYLCTTMSPSLKIQV
ncbi:MAG: 50S ribosomal protein L1 [Candidatus Omnitrophica bacterium]|nr:50S ribosomal protein L1 [Candidatus Omnitrophota bacterium]